jgi:hypothetical protein
LIYLIAPFQFGGGAFFNQRFPWVIFLIILPLLRIDEKFISKRFVLISGASITGLFLIVNTAVFWQQSAKVQKFLSGLNAGIPKGAFVMNYNKWDPEPHWPRIDVLMHAASYYGMFNGCVNIGNYETKYDYFHIHFKDTIPAFPPPAQIGYKVETINLANYPCIQYILGWDINKNDIKKLNQFYHIIYENDPFTIWQRISVSQRR